VTTPFLVAFVAGALAPLLLLKLFHATGVEVREGETALVTRHGRLVATIHEPGHHTLLERLLPWVEVHRVSRRLDFRDFRSVHVNDARGTTITVDLWLEFRIVEPERALFAVSDWDAALHTLVSHATTSILGNRDFREILCNRMELSEAVRRDIASDTARWGIEVEQLHLRNVGLLPEISQQLFDTVAARLEKSRADIEEAGRLAVAKLDADTDVRVAELEANAKAQYPAHVGRALEAVRREGEGVLAAYEELHELAELRPHRTVRFRGFEPGEVRAMDAAMVEHSVVDRPPTGT
jgi:regulator of protease activity HflC (stomatin/prohibitin superfamily)